VTENQFGKQVVKVWRLRQQYDRILADLETRGELAYALSGSSDPSIPYQRNKQRNLRVSRFCNTRNALTIEALRLAGHRDDVPILCSK